MTRFTDIDLARLPSQPKTALLESEYYAAYMADLTARLNAAGIPYDMGGERTDTYAITGEAYAYRTALVAQSIDNAISAVLLPWSWGAYLDALGASQTPAVQRQPIVSDPRPYVPGTDAAADWQDDDTFRALIQLAPEALSTCGPEGAYLFFALDTGLVRAAAASAPMSFGGTIGSPFTGLGEVHIPVVARSGDGTASPALLATVATAVGPKDRRPIADFVTVSPATILTYTLDLMLKVGSGVDPSAAGLAAMARLRALADFQHRPGGQVLKQDLYAAAKVPDAKGTPIVPLVDLGGFSDLNAVSITPSTPGAAYVAPYCPTSDDPVEIEDDDEMTVFSHGGITIRLQVVDD